MELPQRRGLVEEVKRGGGHDGVEGAVVERQLLGRCLQPADLRRSCPSLGEHAVGHVDAVYLIGMQVALNPVGKNPCAAGNIGDATGSPGSQLGDDLVLRRTIGQALKKSEVVGGCSHAPEPGYRGVEASALWCGHTTSSSTIRLDGSCGERNNGSTPARYRVHVGKVGKLTVRYSGRLVLAYLLSVAAAVAMLIPLGGQGLGRAARPGGEAVPIGDLTGQGQRWQAGDRDAAADLVTDEMVLGTTLIGTESMVRQRLRVWRDAGVDTVRLYPAGETLDAKLSTLAKATSPPESTPTADRCLSAETLAGLAE